MLAWNPVSHRVRVSISFLLRWYYNTYHRRKITKFKENKEKLLLKFESLVLKEKRETHCGFPVFVLE